MEKVNMTIQKQASNHSLKIMIDFKEMKEEYFKIALCAIAAFYIQKRIDVFIKDDCIVDGQFVCSRLIQDNQRIVVETTMHPSIKGNMMIYFLGMKTYIQIYYNLYENGGMDEIARFYQSGLSSKLCKFFYDFMFSLFLAKYTYFLTVLIIKYEYQ